MDHSPPGSSVHGDSPGKNTGVGGHVLLQGIFPTQGSNPGLLHCRWILYCLSHQGSPKEGWVPKNWCFPIVMSQKTLKSPLACQEIKPVTPKKKKKKINPEYSLGGLMLKMKLQYFGHLIWRANSLEKTMMLGKIESKSRRGQQRMRRLDSITDSTDMSLSKL